MDFLKLDESIHYYGRGAEANNYMAADALAEFNMNAHRYSMFNDAMAYMAYEDGLEQANKAFLVGHSSTKLSPEFVKYIEITTKYRFINPRWMFKVIYDPKTKSIQDRDLPENYFSFLKQINLNDQEAYDNPNYHVALMRYMNEY